VLTPESAKVEWLTNVMASVPIMNSLMTAELLDPLVLRTLRARLMWEPS